MTGKIEALRQENDYLRWQLAKARRERFGRSSERGDLLDQLPLYEEPMQEMPVAMAETVTAKRADQTARRAGQSRPSLPATLPREEQDGLGRTLTIVFYGAEEFRVTKNQPFILGKLLRTPGIDGVVFFSIDQFCYGEKFNLKLLTSIQKAGYTVHFAREDISLESEGEVADAFLTLSAYFHSLKRKREATVEDILAVLEPTFEMHNQEN